MNFSTIRILRGLPSDFAEAELKVVTSNAALYIIEPLPTPTIAMDMIVIKTKPGHQ